MRIAIIGTGYVGLVSGACLSEFGHEVICIDKDAGKVATLKDGGIPIFEPGLEDVVAVNSKAGRLSFTTDLKGAVKEAEAVFIAVGTPSRRGDGHADLSYVFAAAEEIAESLTGYTVVVTKSTVPVGTSRKVEEIIRRKRPDADFDMASNPEFLREGSALEDFRRPDRVVVGCDTERARAVMREVYRPLYLNETPILFTSRESSELIKYAANAFLATKITFINEMADICEKVGGNVQDVARGIGLDGRIGRKFLHPGPGYGGSCFPKDTMALASFARKAGAPFRLVETVVEVNERQKNLMVEKAKAALKTLKGKKVAVLGLTFKPNTDDIREAPALDIMAGLLRAGAKIRAYDPMGMPHVETLPIGKRIEFADDAYHALDGADCAMLITEWNEFRTLDLKRMKKRLRRPVLLDLRNIYDADEAKAAGLTYVGVGQGATPRKKGTR